MRLVLHEHLGMSITDHFLHLSCENVLLVISKNLTFSFKPGFKDTAKRVQAFFNN